MQLDRHISTHIRESPKAMYRTKLKDLATQTYIRWQDLLAHCQPQVVSHNPLDLGGKGSGQSVSGAWSVSRAWQIQQSIHPHCSCWTPKGKGGVGMMQGGDVSGDLHS